MNYLERASVLLSLTDELKRVGSWCGETHIQKTTFVLQELFNVPLGFRFILYKHGPYSFDLADIITEMRADEFIQIESRHPFGVSISLVPHAKLIFDICPEPREQHLPAIKFVAKRLGPFGVTDLEKLATAFWVTKECPQCPPGERANRISQLKPHISMEESRRAITDMDALRTDATPLVPA